MQAFLVIAAAATYSADGTINVLGATKSVLGPPPLPQYSLLAFVRLRDQHDSVWVQLSLHRADTGEVVTLTAGDKTQRVELGRAFDVPDAERPPHMPTLLTLEVEIAAGMVIAPGSYEWVLSLNGVTDDAWRAPLFVRENEDDFREKPVALRPAAVGQDG